MRYGLRVVAAFTVLWIVLGGCAIDASGASSAPPTVLAAAGTPAEHPATPGEARQTGPKKRIAIAKFDAIGTFVAQYGAWDVGGGLAAQLTTALLDSGQFIVVERAELASLLKEQELATQVGRILRTQLLVAGAVTEFEQRASGGGLRLGLASGIFGGTVGDETVNGVVAMDIRLVDTTTGQVVQSHRVEAKVAQSCNR